MAVTFLKSRTPDTQVVLPQARGVEERDRARFPLPPRSNLGIVMALVKELREQGHDVTCRVEHEKLVNWDETHRRRERSWGSEDDWRPDPKAPTVLRFIAGGCDCRVTVDGRETRLTAEMLRMGRQQLRVILAGRA
jgi:hypothetical protein